MEHEINNGLATLSSIWNFQIFVVDGQAITFGQMLIGLALIVIGYFVSRALSHQVEKKLLTRLSLDDSSKYTFERIVFYVIYIVFVLFVLQLLNVPLAVFSFVGGAMAIGIGFGSQNVINNFISGLIVMITQPLRVRDWIEVDGVFGQVEQIGSRSTEVRTVDNKQLIIPNSHFLESIFTNWSLKDKKVSGRLNVGVAYGTDPTQVRDILLRIAEGHPEILKNPPPGILFKDFGESSLDFELVFWIEISEECTPGRVASDLRFKLDEAFKKAQIEIPFPHRELRIGHGQKIQVEIQRPNG